MQSEEEKFTVLQQWVNCRRKVESKGKRLWMVLRGDSVDLLPDAISRPKISIKLSSIGTCSTVYKTVILSVLDSLATPKWVSYHLEAKDEKVAEYIGDLIVNAMGPNSFDRVANEKLENSQKKKEILFGNNDPASNISNQIKKVIPFGNNEPNSSSNKNSTKSKPEIQKRFSQSQEPQSHKEEPRVSKRVHRSKEKTTKSTKNGGYREDRLYRSKSIQDSHLSTSLPVPLKSPSLVLSPQSASAPQSGHHVPINRLNPFLSGNIPPKTEQGGSVQEDTLGGDHRRDPFIMSGVNPFVPGNPLLGMSGFGGISNIPPLGGGTGFGVYGQNFIGGGTLNQFDGGTFNPFGGGMSNITPLSAGPVVVNGPNLFGTSILGLQGQNYFDNSRMSNVTTLGLDPNQVGGGMSNPYDSVGGGMSNPYDSVGGGMSNPYDSGPFNSGMTNSKVPIQRSCANPFH